MRYAWSARQRSNVPVRLAITFRQKCAVVTIRSTNFKETPQDLLISGLFSHNLAENHQVFCLNRSIASDFSSADNTLHAIAISDLLCTISIKC